MIYKVKVHYLGDIMSDSELDLSFNMDPSGRKPRWEAIAKETGGDNMWLLNGMNGNGPIA
jgi:hypothetical protein